MLELTASPVKTAELIEVISRGMTHMGPRNHVLNRDMWAPPGKYD